MSRNVVKKLLFGVVIVVYSLIICAGGSSGRATPRTTDVAVTFNNQVVRILQQNCQACHRPGNIAPFSLLTYEDANTWARRIKEVTQSRYMPPWKPLAGCGEFQNQRRLTEDEIATIAQWVDAGAPEGNPSELPPPVEFPDEWTLGEPDLVLAPEVEYQPAVTGEDVYRCFSIPTNLTQDRYVSRIEIRPGNRNIVHHVLLFIDGRGESAALDNAEPGPGYTCFGGPGFVGWMFSGWAPGSRPWVLPEGVGVRVPAGARLVMQVHYHPTGEPQSDRTQVGLHFADGPIRKNFLIFALANFTFEIPPGATRYPVTASFTIPRGVDVHALSIFPHMHLLGREMEVRAVLNNGTRRCLIDIDDWDFDWQDMYFYKDPVPLPGRTRLELTAYYDNSADNPNNPNSPPRPVRWGEATTDEMCIVFIGYTLDLENLEADR
jgi:hypothetical protein